MAKKIIIATILLSLIIMVGSSVINSAKYNILLSPFILIYIVYIVHLYIKNNKENSKPLQLSSNLSGQNTASKNIAKKISSVPLFFFEFEKKLVSDHAFYFDDTYLYAETPDGKQTKYLLTDITELSRTKDIIRKSVIWKVILHQKDVPEIIFRFTHNYRFWDTAFAQFHEKIKLLNPSAVKNNFSLWRL